MPWHENSPAADRRKHRKHTLPERTYSFSLRHSFSRLDRATKTMLLGYILENSLKILTMSVLCWINNCSNAHDSHNKCKQIKGSLVFTQCKHPIQCHVRVSRICLSSEIIIKLHHSSGGLSDCRRYSKIFWWYSGGFDNLRKVFGYLRKGPS